MTEVAGDQLRSFIHRVEALEQEKKERANDIKEVYSEAKSTGFDPKIMRAIVRLRKISLQERREQEDLTELYMQAIGMQP